MSNIEERVVRMRFDNAQFEQGVRTTLATLDALNKGLKLDGATKGLNDLNAAGQRVNLSHIGQAVDTIASKFSAMSVVAITALSNIVNRAFDAGASLVKSLTVDPITSGLKEYETNLGSIQTILANTSAAGTTLEQVNEALQELNEYSDQTIYNFAQMAKNIGTFTAAGVALKPATQAIKGIANLAALSGSNAEQASRAMYQLSQAIAAGRVSLEDWNSAQEAGIGGTVFQRALAQTAVAMGKLSEGSVKLTGDMKNVTIAGESFRNSISTAGGKESWLTSDVLTKTLAQFTGDLTDAELAAEGFNAAQIKAIQETARLAKASATEVKTLSQLLGTLQEAVGTGWATTWQLIFGDFEEAKQLFSGVYEVLGGFIQRSAEARNKVLADWKELGGRTAIINSISNAFDALLSVLKPIRDAFYEVFPAVTGKNLADISKAIEKFTRGLELTRSEADKVRRVFSGFFSIFGIGLDIIKLAATTLFELFGVASEGSGDWLDIAAAVGDFLTELRQAIKEGDGLIGVFKLIGSVLAVPIKLLQLLGQALKIVFKDFDASSAAEGVAGFVNALSPLEALGELISAAWAGVVKVFKNLWDFFAPIADKIGDFFSGFADSVGGIDFTDVINSAGVAAFIALVYKIMDVLGEQGGFADVIEGLTDALNGMQHALNAAALLAIAIAIGILALSASELSEIDPGKLANALAGLTVMFVQLIAAMTVMSKIPGGNTAKIIGIAVAMTALGVALRVLVSSVKELSDLEWQELLKGLTGVAALLAAMTGTAKLMPTGAKLINASAGMILLAVGVKILASAVKDLSDLDWAEMSRGLVGVGALLGALALFTTFAKANAGGVLVGAGIILLAVGINILADAVTKMADLSWAEIGRGLTVLAASLVAIGLALTFIPPTAPLVGAGILIVAQAMVVLADALNAMGEMSWGEIGRGLTVLAVALLAIGLALTFIPPTAPLTAAGILIVAYACTILADALQQMGEMSWGEIAKGLVALGVSLALISAAMILMEGSLPGALALLVVSGALLVLSQVMVILGGMSWGEIIKSLVTLAATLLIFAIGGALLTPVVGTLLAFGAALFLVGAGLALAGAGVLLFALGLTALSLAGAAGAAAIVGIIMAIIGLIPAIVKALGIALLALIDILIEAIPKIVELVVNLILQLLVAIEAILPQLAVLIILIIDLILKILLDSVPKIQEAGFQLLMGLLKGIRDKIGKIVDTVGDIIVEFINAVGRNLGKIIQAGVDLLLNFIKGVTKAVNDNSAAMGKAGGDLAAAIVKGMINGLGSAVGSLASKAADLAKSALNAAKNALGIKSPSKEFMYVGEQSGEGLVIGLDNYQDAAAEAGAEVGNSALDALKQVLADIPDITDEDFNFTPTITPVLDLTSFRKNAGEIDGMLIPKQIAPTASFEAAQQASAVIQTNRDIADANAAEPVGDVYNYTQNNNSPKALSSVEIYRQTKNQLAATAKGA